MPRVMLAGGKGHTLLAECAGALLQFFDTPAACALRLVCREFQAAVAAYPWEDRETVILGSIGGWRACFPRARFANVRFYQVLPGWRQTPVVDADFVHFVGLWELNMRGCEAVTDAAFVHLRGIRVLDMGNCNQPTITDAGLAHLARGKHARHAPMLSRITVLLSFQGYAATAAWNSRQTSRSAQASGVEKKSSSAPGHSVRSARPLLPASTVRGMVKKLPYPK